MSSDDCDGWVGSRPTGDAGAREPVDELARAVASGGMRRRRALRLAGAWLLGAAGLGRSAEVAEARRRCPPEGTGCRLRCRDTRKVCVCVRTTGNNRICVHPCCSGRSCRRDAHCRPNEICMVTDCCGTDFQCVTVCNAPQPGYCFRPRTTAWTDAF